MMINKKLNVKISNNYYACELLPPEAFELDEKAFFRLITPWLRIVPQRFREHIGKPVYVNNWWDGGGNKYGGWRPMDCVIGAKFSMHKFGVAFDPKVEGITPPEVLSWFKSHSTFFPEITTYERVLDTPTWNHFDGRFTGLPGLLEVPGK